MHIFLNKNLSANLTGIEHSSLNRLQQFKTMGLEVGYATHHFNLDLFYYIDMYGLDKNHFYNPYLFFLQMDKFEEKQINLEFSALSKVVKLANNDNKIFIKNNLSMYIGYNDQKLKFINYFLDQKNTKREFYYHGNLILEIYFSNDLDKKKIRECYYDFNGIKTIERVYHQCGIETAYITLSLGKKIKIFENESEFLNYWLVNQIVKKYHKVYFYIDRPLRYNLALFSLKSNQVKLIGFIHAIHYNHYRSHMTGRLLTGYQLYFDHIQLIDAIVVGTELQKNDLVERFNCGEKVFVIPPSGLALPETCPVKQKNQRVQLISVGRLAPEKRIDHIIHALSVVDQQGFDFDFHIYGVGPEKIKLQKLVDQYKLNDKIKFLGYSQHILNQIKKADVALIASHYEGFNISIIESFSCATPVIAYNVNYGPKALIKNNINGFLIDNESYHDYAVKLIEIIEGKVDLSTLFKTTFESVQDYSSSQVTKKWHQLIKSVSIATAD